MAKQFGDFIGDFVDYDAKVVAGLRNYMRIRIMMDIRNPLKHKKSLIIGKMKEIFTIFK